jgi:hypothetical protein
VATLPIYRYTTGGKRGFPKGLIAWPPCHRYIGTLPVAKMVSKRFNRVATLPPIYRCTTGGEMAVSCRDAAAAKQAQQMRP